MAPNFGCKDLVDELDSAVSPLARMFGNHPTIVPQSVVHLYQATSMVLGVVRDGRCVIRAAQLINASKVFSRGGSAAASRGRGG
jgi:hypothetical protein